MKKNTNEKLTKEQEEILKTKINADKSDSALHRDINDLDVEVQFKTDLWKAKDCVIQIGYKLVEIGRWIVEKALWLMKEFPGTSKGIAVGAVISWVLASFPGVGFILGPTLGSLIFTISVGAGVLSDLGYKLEQFVAA